ncbi:MAG: hypothetical protein II531_04920, partial [Bacteroidales bacterium]|nr:hypothetical protein [Bacteroidales bacterium]
MKDMCLKGREKWERDFLVADSQKVVYLQTLSRAVKAYNALRYRKRQNRQNSYYGQKIDYRS